MANRNIRSLTEEISFERDNCWDLHSNYGWHLDAQTQPQTLHLSVNELIDNMRDGNVTAMISQMGGDYFVKGKDFRLFQYAMASFKSNLNIIKQFSDDFFLIRDRNDLEKTRQKLENSRLEFLPPPGPVAAPPSTASPSNWACPVEEGQYPLNSGRWCGLFSSLVHLVTD